MIGKENYFVGLVVNCKADPCLKVKNDIVYVPELEREDPEFMGESVSVTGTLPEKKIIPDPKVDESGGDKHRDVRQPVGFWRTFQK